MGLQIMQLLIVGVSLAVARAASSLTAQQNAVHQPGQKDMGSTSLSLADFVTQKQVQKRKAYLDEWKKEISQPHTQATQHRHKASLSAFSTHLHQRAPPPVVYIPQIGVGNVTEPTELPPPPPTLNPNTDMQPFDTRLGDAIASSFLAPPTDTPPPSQEALNLAYGCPVLLGYPKSMQINAPTGCANESIRMGNWSHPTDHKQVIQWTETCDLFTAIMPIVTYATPDGQAFASSRTRFSFFGNTMEILDCGLNLQYTIEEKIYHQTSYTDPDICKKYGSCSGTVFLQYFLRDRLGTILAETPYIKLFQDSFVIQEPGSGLVIATVERVGAWSPWDKCPAWDKLWGLKYAQAPPGIFGQIENRWPIAVLLNMVILRDADRMKTGMVMPSYCEIVNVSILAVVILLLIIIVLVSSLVFYHFCLQRAKIIFYNIEVTCFPHTMYKPSKYEG